MTEADSTQTPTDTEYQVLFFIPEGDMFYETMDSQFRGAGWETRYLSTAEDLRTALQESDLPDLVYLDSNVDGQRELLKEIRLQPEYKRCSFIELYSEQEDPSSPAHFHVRGDEVLIEPFQGDDLIRAGEQVLSESRDRNGDYHRVSFHLPTLQEEVEEAYEYVNALVETCDFPDLEQKKLTAAFREALRNAAEHGNQYRANRIIEGTFERTDREITFRVTDEGKGFDHETLVQQARSSSEDHRPSGGSPGRPQTGFGIKLMLRTVDELEYNDQGNEIRLTYNPDGGREEEDSDSDE